MTAGRKGPGRKVTSTALRGCVKSPRGKDNVHVAYVDSMSEPDVTYELKRRPRDGAMLCGCMAFVFSRATPKTCQHLNAYRQVETWKSAEYFDRPPESRSTVRVKQKVVERGKVPVEREETFTFIRGISFD